MCCALPTGPTIEYERKVEICIFGLVFLKSTFFGSRFIVDIGSPEARGKTAGMYCLTVVLVMLVCIRHASSTENWYEPM